MPERAPLPHRRQLTKRGPLVMVGKSDEVGWRPSLGWQSHATCRIQLAAQSLLSRTNAHNSQIWKFSFEVF